MVRRNLTGILLVFSALLVMGAAKPKPQPAQSCKSVDGLPDPKCTPGAVRTTDKNDICTTKTSTIRPLAAYTNKLKQQQILEYGYKDKTPQHYEEDHLISLELGGDPKDPKNLWPEAPPSPNPKDKVEDWLHKQVCSGAMTVEEAQHGIATNWKQYQDKAQ